MDNRVLAGKPGSAAAKSLTAQNIAKFVPAAFGLQTHKRDNTFQSCKFCHSDAALPLSPECTAVLDPFPALISGFLLAAPTCCTKDALLAGAPCAKPIVAMRILTTPRRFAATILFVLLIAAAVLVGCGVIPTPPNLWAKTDTSTYHPGEAVTVQAVMVNFGSRLMPGYTFAATATAHDGATVALTFYDDGTHGDNQPGDGIYAAQSPAPGALGQAKVSVQASKGPFVLHKEVSFSIIEQTAKLVGVANERTVDENHDGFIDALELDVTFDVLKPGGGGYELQGFLFSGDTHIATDTTSSTPEGPLATGLHTVTLSYTGKELRANSVGGPYTLNYLSLSHYVPDQFWPVLSDSADYVYTTTVAYPVDQFYGPPLRILAAEEEMAGPDAAGYYVSLGVNVQFAVMEPGNYSWVGTLVDANGNAIGQAHGNGRLKDRWLVTFVFPGRMLQSAGRDGPYTLTDVSVTPDPTWGETFHFANVFTTKPYKASQFTDASRH